VAAEDTRFVEEENMKKTLFIGVLALVLVIGFTLNLFSQAKPDAMVKQRQAAMTLQGKYFGPLGGMAQGKIPYSGEVVVRNAGYLEALSQMPWDGFNASTSKEKSRALPAVFTDTAKFKKAADDMQAAVKKLATASKGKDEAGTKAAIGAVGKSCGECHESFRQKD
jgi:cytochrome c556